MSERRLAAILFSDIVGYTALMGRDESKAFELLKINREIHDTCIKRFEGTLIKEMGDGILASFASAFNAVQCAVAIEEECKAENIKLRIGIHTGDVIFEGGDVLGDGVNVASRLEELAPEGCIYISGSVYKDVKNKSGFRTEFIDETTLKNVEEPVKVYEVSNVEKTSIEKLALPKGQPKRIRSKLIYFIIAGFGFVIIVFALLWFLFFKSTSGKEERRKEKSIAVLPFRNESDEKGTEYFANGVMEAILNNLAKISELRVPGRTSVEQFRGHTETIPQIAKKLNVSYILEGSVQKYENTVRITFQLIDGSNDDHIWSVQYDKEYKNILQVESELAQNVARELKVRLTPQEKQIIEKIPTTSLKAYDLFLRARDEHIKYWLDNTNKQSLENAYALYLRALQIDSTYAQSYTGLAQVYSDKRHFETYLKDSFLDSSLILADKALSFNDQLDEAYYVRGNYYWEKGEPDKALKEYNISLRINPNYSLGYWQRSFLYIWAYDNIIDGLQDNYKAISLDHSPLLPFMMSSLGAIYFYHIGFKEKGIYFSKEKLNLDNDSIFYLNAMSSMESYTGNYNKSLALDIEVLKKDSLNIDAIGSSMSNYSYLGRYKEAYQAMLKFLRLKKGPGYGDIDDLHRFAFYFWQAGHKKEAEYYFNEQVRYCEESIRLGRWYAQRKQAQYDLAGVYAFRGEKEKAIQLLNEVNKREYFLLWWVILFKTDPLLDNLRSDPRFQKILSDVERKYEKKREEVRVWLEKEGML